MIEISWKNDIFRWFRFSSFLFLNYHKKVIGPSLRLDFDVPMKLNHQQDDTEWVHQSKPMNSYCLLFPLFQPVNQIRKCKLISYHRLVWWKTNLVIVDYHFTRFRESLAADWWRFPEWLIKWRSIFT